MLLVVKMYMYIDDNILSIDFFVWSSIAMYTYCYIDLLTIFFSLVLGIIKLKDCWWSRKASSNNNLHKFCSRLCIKFEAHVQTDCRASFISLGVNEGQASIISLVESCTTQLKQVFLILFRLLHCSYQVLSTVWDTICKQLHLSHTSIEDQVIS